MKKKIELYISECVDAEYKLEAVVALRPQIDESRNCYYIEVETLEEYFNLLEKISNVTDGEFSVYNCGTFIQLWED